MRLVATPHVDVTYSGWVLSTMQSCTHVTVTVQWGAAHNKVETLSPQQTGRVFQMCNA